MIFSNRYLYGQEGALSNLPRLIEDNAENGGSRVKFDLIYQIQNNYYDTGLASSLTEQARKRLETAGALQAGAAGKRKKSTKEGASKKQKTAVDITQIISNGEEGSAGVIHFGSFIPPLGGLTLVHVICL